jgi:hypothetical protein
MQRPDELQKRWIVILALWSLRRYIEGVKLGGG